MSERKSSEKFQEAGERLAWEIASTAVRFEELRNLWAKRLDVTGPQLMIMTALNNADRSTGIAVGAVSRMLRVDQSFIVTQSKILEKKGFLRRKTSAEDARVVNLSLTDRANKLLASLATQREKINDLVYSEFTSDELAKLIDSLSEIKQRLEKAVLKVAADH